MEATALIKHQLQFIGEDADREGLLKTPLRVFRMWQEIYAGYEKNPEDVLTVFEADGYNQIILLKNIELYSMCEHHMLPFYGKAHIAYLPKPTGKIVGISKLARLLDIYAKRLQIQERIGDQVTDDIMRFLQPQGAVCIIEATHMCMRMRGVEKQNSVMSTSSMRGVFLKDAALRSELMQLIQMK